VHAHEFDVEPLGCRVVPEAQLTPELHPRLALRLHADVCRYQPRAASDVLRDQYGDCKSGWEQLTLLSGA
jgi:hypothetical protein